MSVGIYNMFPQLLQTNRHHEQLRMRLFLFSIFEEDRNALAECDRCATQETYVYALGIAIGLELAGASALQHVCDQALRHFDHINVRVRS